MTRSTQACPHTTFEHLSSRDSLPQSSSVVRCRIRQSFWMTEIPEHSETTTNIRLATSQGFAATWTPDVWYCRQMRQVFRLRGRRNPLNATQSCESSPRRNLVTLKLCYAGITSCRAVSYTVTWPLFDGDMINLRNRAPTDSFAYFDPSTAALRTNTELAWLSLLVTMHCLLTMPQEITKAMVDPHAAFTARTAGVFCVQRTASHHFYNPTATLLTARFARQLVQVYH